MFGKFSLGTFGLIVGGTLMIVGAIAYVTDNATLNLAGFFYGLPLLLGGFALKAAELKPIPFSQPTSPDILALREKQATSTLNQVREDVTRYRYGQAAHLDEVLKRLGLAPNDEQRPVLTSLRETMIDNNYALVLEFDSPFIPFTTWQEKQEKMTTFFGPGVQAQVMATTDNKVELTLVCTNIA